MGGFKKNGIFLSSFEMAHTVYSISKQIMGEKKWNEGSKNKKQKEIGRSAKNLGHDNARLTRVK